MISWEMARFPFDCGLIPVVIGGRLLVKQTDFKIVTILKTENLSCWNRRIQSVYVHWKQGFMCTLQNRAINRLQ